VPSVLVVSVCLTGCDWDGPNRAQVEPLVASAATKQEVAAKFGSGYTRYGTAGDPEHAALEQFLGREPVEQYKPVRAAVKEGRRIRFYTTALAANAAFLRPL
jgi:hypothetical protein